MIVKGTSNSMHDNCELQDKGTNPTGLRSFYCPSHQQWTYVFPAAQTFTYSEITGLPPVTRQLITKEK